MHLNYHTGEQLQAVLLSNERRIEFHIGRLNDELFALVMLSGEDQKTPDRVRHQGPFHAIDQAKAAIRAVANILEAKGYRAQNSIAIWPLQAQAELRATRQMRMQHKVNTRFVPLGIPPER